MKDADNRVLQAGVGAVLLLAALLVLVWPGLTVHGLAVLLGVALVVEGVLRVAGAFRGETDQRITALLSAAASIILGVLALAWPDVTVFVVAVLFGIRLVMIGGRRLWAAARGRAPRARRDATPTRSWAHRFSRTVSATAALVLALVLLGVSARLHDGEPEPDAFYSAPPDVPGEPGRLLRAEPFTRAIPHSADAWRILYTTTRDEGDPAVASALVLVSRSAPTGPRPVIAWAHGTTGYDESCAPTLLEDPLGSGAMPALDRVIDNGWVLVATDYVGLGTEGPHPYLIGQGEARSVLDAVRAARRLEGVSLSDRTVVWGHSQGGNAALWTGIIQPTYAPDVALAGVAALAPASDLPGLVGNLDDVKGGSLFASFVVQAYADTYEDVDLDSYIKPQAQVQVHEMAARCLSEPEVFVSVVESLLFDGSIFSQAPTAGSLGRRLEQNTPSGAIAAPLLIGQGESDELVLPSAQAAYVARRCADGGQVDYRTYPERDHVGVVADDSPLVPDLLRWTTDRFDAEPATSTCP